MEIRIHVEAHGPVFDGRAQAAVREYKHHLENTLGETGVTMIKAYLPTQYMYLGHNGGSPLFNPVPPNAGALQAAIHTERQTEDAVLITDDPVTYGAWIEGVDSMNLIIWPHRRNPPPRRFPGYHTFRKMTKVLNARAVPIAYRELPYYIRMMNN